MAKRTIEWEVTRRYKATVDVDDDWTHDVLYDLADHDHETSEELTVIREVPA